MHALRGSVHLLRPRYNKCRQHSAGFLPACLARRVGDIAQTLAQQQGRPSNPFQEMKGSHNGNGSHSPYQQPQQLNGTGHGTTNGNGSSNGNGRPHATPPILFHGSTVTELQRWLEEHGVDTSGYGSGLAKRVADLLEEQAREESVLSLEERRPLRTVRVLSLHILNDAGQVLFEDEQILPDGRARRRQVAVSEKLVGEEAWQQAVHRAVQEELAMALPSNYKVEVLEHTYRRLEELSTSMSYPGLITKYVFHRVSARLPGLPSGPFETWEERPGGQLVTRWVWKDVATVEELERNTATSSQG